jgi:hypothetical protein
VEGWLTVDVLAEVETRVAIMMRVIAVVVVLRTADVFFVNFAFFSFAMELQLEVALFGLMSGNYLKLSRCPFFPWSNLINGNCSEIRN